MPAFTKIIVLYNFRYKKLSKLCIQLLRYKQPVPYLPVNATMDNTILKKWSVSNAGIYEKYFISDTRNFPNNVYNETDSLAQVILIGMCIGIKMSSMDNTVL